MKLDQIAFYAMNDDAFVEICRLHGLSPETNWVRDRVESSSRVNYRGKMLVTKQTALLAFNYSLGIEFEILRYIDGWHWQSMKEESYHAIVKGEHSWWMSHIGYHLDDGEPFPTNCGKLVQHTFTKKHTAEYLTKEGSPGYGRTYEYQIFKTTGDQYVKYIKRVHPNAK